ncbi:MAG: hypothetical protein OHK0039_18710 [Bacteroidia bacterium]
MAQPPQETTFNLLFLLDIVRRYLLYIAAVVGLSVLAALIFSMPFIYPPEFRSSVVVYPASSERFDISNIFYEEPNLYLYGGAKEVEKIENLALSETVTFFVIDSLDLWSAYGVNKSTDAAPKYKVLRTYRANVKTIRTAGNGLEIEAYDRDPLRAAAIVNLIVQRIDALNKDMLDRNKETMLHLLEAGSARLEAQIAVLADSAARLRARYGILRSLTQSEVLAEQVLVAEGELAEARARLGEAQRIGGATGDRQTEVRAKEGKLRALTQRGTAINLEQFLAGVDAVKALEDLLENLSIERKNAEARIQYLRVMDQTPYSTLLITEEAQPADKKARPVRWIILLATLLISTLVSILGVVLIDRLMALVGDRRQSQAQA